MIFKLDIRLFFLLCLGFIIATPLGTIHHELGHILVAKAYGHETRLSYDRMSWDYEENKTLTFKEFNVTIGGVLNTMLTGLFSFMLLFFLLKRSGWKDWYWILVFLSFFLARQVFNLCYALGLMLFSTRANLFGTTSDEAYIARFLGVDTGYIALPLVALSGILLTYLVFKMLPKDHVLSFLSAGLVGSAIGFIIWFLYLGPMLLPI